MKVRRGKTRGKWQTNQTKKKEWKRQWHSMEKCLSTGQHGKQDQADVMLRSGSTATFQWQTTHTCTQKWRLTCSGNECSSQEERSCALLVWLSWHNTTNLISPIIHLQGIHGSKHKTSSVGKPSLWVYVCLSFTFMAITTQPLCVICDILKKIKREYKNTNYSTFPAFLIRLQNSLKQHHYKYQQNTHWGL